MQQLELELNMDLRVHATIAVEYVHLTTNAGWTALEFISVARATLGHAFADLPYFYGLTPEGDDEWFFFFDRNMAQPQERPVEYA